MQTDDTFVDVLQVRNIVSQTLKGGLGSGFFGHAGRAGKVGGSSASQSPLKGYSESEPEKAIREYWEKRGNVIRSTGDAIDSIFVGRDGKMYGPFPTHTEAAMDVLDDVGLSPAMHYSSEVYLDKMMKIGFLRMGVNWNTISIQAETLTPAQRSVINQLRKELPDSEIAFEIGNSFGESWDEYRQFLRRAQKERLKGGPGSGFFGHAGRVGKIGGSSQVSGAQPSVSGDAQKISDTWRKNGQEIDPEYEDEASIWVDADGHSFGPFEMHSDAAEDILSRTGIAPNANGYEADGILQDNGFMAMGITARAIYVNGKSPSQAQKRLLRRLIKVKPDHGIEFEFDTPDGKIAGTTVPEYLEFLSKTSKGGTGSGFFGHSGVPGHRGGSAPAGSSAGVDQEAARKMITSLARQQRDLPEKAMVNAQMAIGGGELSFLLEHAGDLIHRMSEDVTYDQGGYPYVIEKVNKILNSMRNSGISQTVSEQRKSNAEYRVSTGKVKSVEEYQEKFHESLHSYVSEHRKLKPLNRVQGLANLIAISIGQLDFRQARVYTNDLKEILDKGRENWIAEAHEINPAYTLKGGEGSGFFGHRGRRGSRGGSVPKYSSGLSTDIRDLVVGSKRKLWYEAKHHLSKEELRKIAEDTKNALLSKTQRKVLAYNLAGLANRAATSWMYGSVKEHDFSELTEFVTQSLKGGVGSGFFGHSGRPGHQGGSAPQSGGQPAYWNGEIHEYDSASEIVNKARESFRSDRHTSIGYWVRPDGKLVTFETPRYGLLNSMHTTIIAKLVTTNQLDPGDEALRKRCELQMDNDEPEDLDIERIGFDQGWIKVRFSIKQKAVLDVEIDTPQANRSTLKRIQKLFDANKIPIAKVVSFLTEESDDSTQFDFMDVMTASTMRMSRTYGNRIVELKERTKGGAGSGFFGHAGRPGFQGGSAPSGASASIRVGGSARPLGLSKEIGQKAAELEKRSQETEKDRFLTAAELRRINDKIDRAETVLLRSQAGLLPNPYTPYVMEDRIAKLKAEKIEIEEALDDLYAEANRIRVESEESLSEYYDMIKQSRKVYDSMSLNELGVDEWENASIAIRRSQKNSLIENLATRSGVSYQDAHLMVAQWAATSNDNDYESLMMQKAISEEFGVKLSEWQRENLEKTLPMSDGYYPPGKARIHEKIDDHLKRQSVQKSIEKKRKVLSAMYQSTQSLFAKYGYSPNDEITLFRGVKHISGAEPYETIRYRGNAAESWTVVPGITTSYGATLAMKVKVRDILSTPFTGLGCLTEGEIVVLGNNDVNVTYIGR